MKKFASVVVLLLALTSCSSGRSPEQLQALVDLTSFTGTMKEIIYDSSDGPQAPWYLNLADDYIASVMGFDGTNGDSDMGKVSQAFFKGCMGF